MEGRKYMKRISKYFLQGLLVVVPLAVTAYVLYRIFLAIDGLLGFKIPGVGFLVTLFLITFVGFLASHLIPKRVFRMFDQWIGSLPFVKLLYSSIKDLLEAFVGKKKTFDRPVMVTLVKESPAKVIGFVTAESLEHLGIRDSVAVYLPQSYNFAGNLIIFPKDHVQPLNKDGADVMAFVMSGGVSGRK
jgi:uncharacterized membrane protein